MFDSNKPRQRANKQYNAVAIEIKRARLEAGMTQRALSDFSGISLKAIRTLEQGGNQVSLAKLNALCDFLGLEVTLTPRIPAIAKEHDDA